MWQADYTISRDTLSVADFFVSELLDWASSQEPTQTGTELEALALRAEPQRLGTLASKLDNVRIYMARFAQCKHVAVIRQAHKYATGQYVAFLEGGAPMFQAPDEPTEQLVTEAFEYFYDNMLDTAAFRTAYGAAKDRKGYRITFARTRPVCPYCDRRSIENPYDSSIDHFLPHSRFPLLSVCWFNLIPSCDACNERAKGRKLIGTDAVGRCWRLPICHPYLHEVAAHIQFVFEFETSRPSLKIVAPKTEWGTRAQNFCDVFNIEEVYGYDDTIGKLHQERIQLRTATRQTPGVSAANVLDTYVGLLQQRRYFWEKLKGQRQMAKLLLDFFEFLAANAEREVEYILDTPEFRYSEQRAPQ